MDLHGNVSWRLAQQTDLITCYRLAPHEDAMESKQRAAENLLSRIESGKGKPAFKAWIMALTPGGVDQDLERLDYRRIMRPMFPLDPGMETPDLGARLVPPSDAVSANQPER
jgi:microcystin degradation protein MlrC